MLLEGQARQRLENQLLGGAVWRSFFCGSSGGEGATEVCLLEKGRVGSGSVKHKQCF